MAKKQALADVAGSAEGNFSTSVITKSQVHVQHCSVSRQAELFSGSFYPDDKYDPYKD